MSGSHEGRVALVTGAARGIGRALAEGLSARGARLVLVDTTDTSELSAELQSDCLPIVADVSREEDWARVSSLSQERFGQVDIVINNAAIALHCGFEQLDYATFRRTLDVNLDANFFSAKYLAPQMQRRRWGRFVAISSVAVASIEKGMAPYITSKMAVIGLVRALANELGADGITVNAVLPTLIDTPATRDIPDELKQQVWQSQPVPRFGQPADIVGPVAFLTSDDGAFVTGQTLNADGGLYKAV